MKAIGMTLLKGFEKTYTFITGSKNIPNSKHNLIRIVQKKHRGKAIELPDSIINEGDLVIEIHVDNLQAENLNNTLSNVMNLLDDELKALSANENKEVKGVYCTTLFYGMLKRKGFTTFPLEKSLINDVIARWEGMLRKRFNSQTKQQKKRYPMVCWISYSTLQKRYGGH